MSNIIPVPTLSTFGWATNTVERIDFLLTHIFYADKFQTSLYGNNVTSIQWLLEEAGGDMAMAATSMGQAINTYLTRYYDSARVDVDYKDEDPEKSASKVIMTLNIAVTENGIEHQVSRLISVVDGRFKEFINLNNEGVVQPG